MTGRPRAIVYGVEGATDAPVAEALIRFVGRRPRQGLIAHGKTRLDPRIRGWNRPGNLRPGLVLRDWDPDDGAGCVPEHVRRLLGGPLLAPGLALRIPVHAVEAWLMADRVAFTRYFATDVVPGDPDSLPAPKRAVVDACRWSSDPGIRADMLPNERSGRQAGPLFEARIIDFARREWSVERARHGSPSLQRAVDRLRALVDSGRW